MRYIVNIVRYFWLLSARKVLQALLNIFLSEILWIKFVLLKNAQLLIDSSKMLKQQTLLKKSLSLLVLWSSFNFVSLSGTMIYLGIFVSSFTISWKRFVKKSEFKANLILRSFPTLSEFLDQMTSLRVNLIEKVSQSVGRSFLQISHHCNCWKFLSSLTLPINQHKCPCMLISMRWYSDSVAAKHVTNLLDKNCYTMK